MFREKNRQIKLDSVNLLLVKRKDGNILCKIRDTVSYLYTAMCALQYSIKMPTLEYVNVFTHVIRLAILFVIKTN